MPDPFDSKRCAGEMTLPVDSEEGTHKEKGQGKLGAIKKLDEYFRAAFRSRLDCENTNKSCGKSGNCRGNIYYIRSYNVNNKIYQTEKEGSEWIEPMTKPVGKTDEYEAWWNDYVKIQCSCGPKPDKPETTSKPAPPAKKESGTPKAE